MSNRRRARPGRPPAARARAAASGRGTRPAPRRYSGWWIVGIGAVIVVVAVIAAVALSGGGSSSSSGSVQTAKVTVDGTALATYPSAGNTDTAVGSAVPTLVGKTLGSGGPITIAPDGKPFVVAFVAHWCPHCQAEVPRLVALQKANKLSGVRVVAVATGTRANFPNYPPSAWLKRVHWPFAAMADSTTSTGALAYGLSAYPLLTFVRADGTVAGRTEGELSDSDVVLLFDALAAGKALPLASVGAASPRT
jgi:cytochrome c biogenesis protein CcmG/thiol:disulfide interchange protein DsbE